MRMGGAVLAMCVALAACERGEEARVREDVGGAARAKATVAPPLRIAHWYGSEPLSLEALRGKVVLLDFWNTTCGPCRKLMPHLEELYRKHKAEGLIVIGVTEDAKADLEEFLRKNPVGYPVAIDELKGGAGVTFDAYKVGSIPTVCLIGRDGGVAWQGTGEKLTDAMVLAELAKK